LHAAPDLPAGDVVLQMLQDKGLLPTAAQLDANPLVQQMRDTASELVMQAMNFLGVPYRRGGNTAEQGFDCSGFTRHVFENSIGLVLPRRADEQAKSSSLLNVKREELKPGDLVFFNTMRRAFSHVGIYVGDGKFIHAPRAGGEVRVEDMRQAYWSKRFNGARRAELPAPDATANAPHLQ
jgi:cell wall-associated NlpC family hydrolase